MERISIFTVVLYTFIAMVIGALTFKFVSDEIRFKRPVNILRYIGIACILINSICIYAVSLFFSAEFTAEGLKTFAFIVVSIFFLGIIFVLAGAEKHKEIIKNEKTEKTVAKGSLYGLVKEHRGQDAEYLGYVDTLCKK